MAYWFFLCRKININIICIRINIAIKTVLTIMQSASTKAEANREKLDTIIIENEDSGNKGNFWHFRHKKRKYFYEDFIKGKDRHFHVDVGTECDDYFRNQKVQYKEKKTETFYHVVDLDSYEYHKVVFHSFLNAVLQSAWFRFSILGLVMLSAIMIGLSTSDSFNDYSELFKVIDQIILSVFIFEIIIKWMYDFRLFWKVAWNILDFVIVSLIIATAMFPLENDGSKAIVMVRVVRAFRSLKSVSSLTSLSIVTHTVIKSGVDMGNILLVLIVFMLVMSVMGVILFDQDGLNTSHFLNALNAWFLLFICVTQDGWNSALDEFREFQDQFVLLALYLILAVSIGSFVFANLIVAVIVANLELSVKELRDEKKLSDDPLDTKEGFIINELEIIPTYELFAENNLSMLAQRPMNIPTLKHISLRRIQTYISLIVALEQNMLESEIIHLDFEKIMAVILSIILQLDVYSAPENEKEKEVGAEVLADLKRLSILEKERPQDALDRMEQAAYITKFKHRQSLAQGH